MSVQITPAPSFGQVKVGSQATLSLAFSNPGATEVTCTLTAASACYTLVPASVVVPAAHGHNNNTPGQATAVLTFAPCVSWRISMSASPRPLPCDISTESWSSIMSWY